MSRPGITMSRGKVGCEPCGLGETEARPAAVLRALADRCEREAPSRELERDIARGLGVTAIYWIQECPFYCHSLDAAVALAPGGWWINSISYSPRWKKWGVALMPPDGLDTRGYADTEPMARVAAALRAWAQEGHAPGSANEVSHK